MEPSFLYFAETSNAKSWNGSTQSSEDSLGSKENALTVDPFKVDDDADEESDGLDGRLVNNDDFHWEAQMMGPMNSPYADHFFNLIVRFGPNFPLSPPLVNFRTKVFHPNISITGGIELDILLERWNPALTIPKVLQRIRQLMAEPNVNAPHPSSTQALQLYLDDHDRYLRIAEAWTLEHADVGAGE
ncbi:hypothetical protein BUALT_BualtUnG0020200 [Buddleja alternifolia]|uniref:UBC core domain-containing protein n=1 Tax=Buddleja alternifolia TaxID=168488 RepID=A0AAV6VZ57_9LAMI|nr:hypothetical protein BUALT_BualtUnG0020200 [Buddleja alternifolia]